MSPTDGRSFDPNGASEFLARLNLPVSPSVLARMRMRGEGPDYFRWCAKRIRYHEKSLLTWAADQMHPCRREVA
jgi:hypothetical protein